MSLLLWLFARLGCSRRGQVSRRDAGAQSGWGETRAVPEFEVFSLKFEAGAGLES